MNFFKMFEGPKPAAPKEETQGGVPQDDFVDEIDRARNPIDRPSEISPDTVGEVVAEELTGMVAGSAEEGASSIQDNPSNPADRFSNPADNIPD